MDPRSNPFAPGAGAPPPALVGRDNIVEAADIALHRIRDGRPEKSQMLLGLRGVGKTVLLNKIAEIARDLGYLLVKLEAPEGQRLAAYLAPALKSTLIQLSRSEKAKDLAGQALGALRGFAGAFRVSIGEFEVGISEAPTLADSGNLEIDLAALLISVGRAAKADNGCVAILVDEIQYLAEEDLRALIVAFHMIAQEGLPVVMFGAGLPQVAGLAGHAKSYAERLFDYPPVGPLSEAAAREAIQRPLQDEGIDIEGSALTEIVEITRGYPYFLQEWGKHAWRVADASPIDLRDVQQANAEATEALDNASPASASSSCRATDATGDSRRSSSHGTTRAWATTWCRACRSRSAAAAVRAPGRQRRRLSARSGLALQPEDDDLGAAEQAEGQKARAHAAAHVDERAVFVVEALAKAGARLAEHDATALRAGKRQADLAAVGVARQHQGDVARAQAARRPRRSG